MKIFLKAITSCNSEIEQNIDGLRILTSDDFDIGVANDYECYYIIVERRKRFLKKGTMHTKRGLVVILLYGWHRN